MFCGGTECGTVCNRPLVDPRDAEITRLRTELEAERKLRVQCSEDSAMHLHRWQETRAELYSVIKRR